MLLYPKNVESKVCKRFPQVQIQDHIAASKKQKNSMKFLRSENHLFIHYLTTFKFGHLLESTATISRYFVLSLVTPIALCILNFTDFYCIEFRTLHLLIFEVFYWIQQYSHLPDPSPQLSLQGHGPLSSTALVLHISTSIVLYQPDPLNPL